MRHVGSALFRMFAQGKLGGGDLETVGIWSQNRPGEAPIDILHIDTLISNTEWQIVDIALHCYKKVGVSLYDTLGKESVGKQMDTRMVPVSLTSV